MLTRLAKSALISILVLALATAGRGGEEPSGTPDGVVQTFGTEVSVGYVLIPVVVRARNGFAERLSKADFQVRVDESPIEIESFESGALAPIGVLFLQDLSGSMGVGQKLAQSRALVDCFLRQRRNGDEFAVASFSDQQLFVEVPFPGSLPAIREVATQWEGYGRTALHDAVAWLPDIVHSRVSPRRAVVLITDGVDNASVLDPAQAREEIRHADVPVHVVGLETGSFETLHPEGGKMHPLADTLNLIGWATGGGYHPVKTSGDVIHACKTIVESLRHQYVLGFPTRAEGGQRRHEIDVEISGRSKKLRITYRRSYEGTLPRRMESSG
ncbi:MAG: VWA domain-containing protein [Acidobacteria bacterium]|nr:VWA domain-containing protein [Acidobacteriota bacterium]